MMFLLLNANIQKFTGIWVASLTLMITFVFNPAVTIPNYWA